MKKIIFIFLVIIIILMTPTVILTLINSQNDRIINGYYSSSEHFDEEGFQDYTDYCEYYYRKNDIKKIKNSKYYKKVKNNNIKELKVYFKDYSKWIIYREGYKDWYKFDYKKQVKLNHYYYIENKGSNASSLIDKFVSYDIYYYDVDKNTLYYFHTNIWLLF